MFQLRREKKEMSSEALFSTGGGFLCGALAGYAIKKIVKIGAIIVGRGYLPGWLKHSKGIWQWCCMSTHRTS